MGNIFSREPLMIEKVGRKVKGGIEYRGLPGVTQICLEAVAEILMGERRVTQAKLLTCEHRHAFLLILEETRQVAIKWGFASGYEGEGPRGLAACLRLLDAHQVPVAEYRVSQDFMEKLNASLLDDDDLQQLQGEPYQGSAPWHGDVFAPSSGGGAEVPLWYRAPLVLPAAILDPRLHDLAILLWKDPDAALMKAFRRLEDIVRGRTGIDAEGTKLFTAALRGDKALLAWPKLPAAEREARANLFCGAFGTYRNPQMHSERDRTKHAYFSEFLLVNELFRLERGALHVSAVAQAFDGRRGR